MVRQYDASSFSGQWEVAPAEHEALPPGFPALPEHIQHAFTPARNGVVAARAADSRGVRREVLPQRLPQLRQGAYHLTFTPDENQDLPARPDWPELLGIIRFERLEVQQYILLSGDLYLAAGIVAAPDFRPDDIPIHPLQNYHAYLRTIAPMESIDNPLTRLVMECHRVSSRPWNQWSSGVKINLTLQKLERMDIPDSDEPVDDHVTKAIWDVSDESGQPLGKMEWQWVSGFFRRAVVEVDCEAGFQPPTADGNGNTIESVFAESGWKVEVETGGIEVRTPPSGQWTLAEVHEAMLRSRSSEDLDSEWRYHVSAVDRFAGTAPLGISYDHEASDLNGVPREDVAVQLGASLPDERIFGKFAGRRVADVPELSFLIVLHELGHAMGLYHNNVGYGIMQQIDDLARDSRDGFLTSESLRPEFDGKDLFRLRHLPEIYVRPGGTDWETQGLVEDRDEAVARAGFAGHPPRIFPDPQGPFRLSLTPVATVYFNASSSDIFSFPDSSF